jgi:hypothetical protein
MAATIPSTALIPVQPVFTDAERLALASITVVQFVAMSGAVGV